VGSSDDFDEGRFAGSVFAQERVDFARLQFKRNTTESAHGAERFGDLGELKKRESH
jgi:hypothetical protein